MSGPTSQLRPNRRPTRTRVNGEADAAVHSPPLDTPTPRAVAPTRHLRRADVYSRPVVDGQAVSDNALTRLRALVARLFESPAEREEAKLDTELTSLPGGSRSNTISVISPKGGVGKTTSTFLVGNALASHLRLRVVAVDTNPDFGTLGELAPETRRVDKTLTELVAELDRVHSASELKTYVSQLPSGLHLLAAPAHAEVMAQMSPDHYGELLAFLSRYYDVVLLDCGTGVTHPLAQFAVRRSDQTIVVTTPEWITASSVLGALRHLELDRSTLVLNQAQPESTDRRAIEAHFRRERLRKRVTIPWDEQLRTMLDSATYSLPALRRPVRLPIKQLALAVGEQLV